VTSLAGLTGAVTFSSPGGTIGITPNGQDIELTNTGVLSVTAGAGISISTIDGVAEVTNTLPGFSTTGFIDQTGFTLETVGANAGQYFKAVSIPGMFENGIVIGTTSGTPAVCKTAWITTITPGVDVITIWVDANPVVVGQTWEAHYVIATYGAGP
jgi:hypothetical protein